MGRNERVTLVREIKKEKKMDKAKKVGKEEVIFKGKHFEIVQQPMKIGEKGINFEYARRSPGTRLIIIKNEKILLTKEWRTELNGYDWRLPGGKVFDSLEEYNNAREAKEYMLKHATTAAKKECKEETGHISKKITHYHTTAPGALVRWDLYYFLIDESEEHQDGQQLESGEVIEVHWFTFDEVKEMCVKNKIKEDRTVGVLLRYLLEKEK
jgi:ADP-ribose pyrophosphatase